MIIKLSVEFYAQAMHKLMIDFTGSFVLWENLCREIAPFFFIYFYFKKKDILKQLNTLLSIRIFASPFFSLY